MLGYPLDHICWGEPPTDISPSFSQCCGWASPWDHYDYKTHPHKKIIRKLKNNIHSEKYPEHPWASEVTERNWGSGDLSLCLCWGWRMGHLGFHKGFPGSSAGKESACNVRNLGLISGLGRSPGEGKGYPLHYSGLDNFIDCIVHGITKSWT